MADEEATRKKNAQRYVGFGVALGAGFGAALGAGTGNMGLWLSVGIAVGVAIGAALSKKAAGAGGA